MKRTLLTLGGVFLGAGALFAEDSGEVSETLYQETNRFESGVRQICAMTCRGESLYIVGEKQFTIMSLNGETQKVIRLKETPVNIETSQDGETWLVYPHRLEVLSSGGVVQEKWGFSDSGTRLASVLCAGELIYVGDSGCNIVRVIERTTRKERLQIGKRNMERGISGISAPEPFMDLALCQEGLWVVNTGRCCVELYDTKNGDLLSDWGGKGDHLQKFCVSPNPVRMIRLPGGEFVTVEKSKPRVKVYSPRGKFETVLAEGKNIPVFDEDKRTMKKMLLDVACDAQGRIYLAGTGDGIIRIFEKKVQDKLQ